MSENNQTNPVNLDLLFNKKLALVLDDHTIFAEAFAKTLQDFHFFKNVVPFSDGGELLDYIMQLRSLDNVYLFLDYYVGETVIPSILPDIKRILKKPKVIIISGITSPVLIANLLELKPDGIVHKSDKTSEILLCIHAIKDGEKYYSESIKEIIDSTGSHVEKIPFSPREMELLVFFAKGMTVDQTAEHTNLSPHTVSAHRRKMFSKAGVNNISELLAFARKLELI